MFLILNCILTAISIAIAAWLVPGIEPFGAAPYLCFLFTGFFLGIVNAFVKPVLTVLSLPVTILTLGIFQLVLNGLMLELAAGLSVDVLGAGISIASPETAFTGAIVVSIACSILGVKQNG